MLSCEHVQAYLTLAGKNSVDTSAYLWFKEQGKNSQKNPAICFGKNSQ